MIEMRSAHGLKRPTAQMALYSTPLDSSFVIQVILLLLGRQCVRAGEPPFNFGTKTPYHYGYSSFSKPQHCEAVHINMVLRHGSRYMSGSDRASFGEMIEKLNAPYRDQRARFRSKNLSLPWDWPADWNDADSSELSERGEREHYEIAQRYAKRFPEIFQNRTYWNKLFQFVTTDKKRTTQSAVAFSFGLFEGDGPLGSNKFQPVALKFSGPKDQDKLLRPYDTCPRYEEEIEDGGGLQEYEEFKSGREIKRVSENLEGKLNVSGGASLEAEVLFKLCAFGVSLQNDWSWCSLFDKDDADVLQYLQDLETYYESSYGHELSYKIICPLVADITDTLASFTAGNRLPLGIFRFTHSGTVIALLTALNLYKDPLPLRADNYAKQSARKFRTSEISPMAANAAFILYRCEGGTLKVQLLINEAPTAMPCCHGNSVCGLQEFLSCYGPIGKNCDFDGMCKLPVKSSARCGYFFWGNLILCALSVMFA